MFGSIFAAFRIVDYVPTARAFFLIRHHYYSRDYYFGTFFLSLPSCSRFLLLALSFRRSGLDPDKQGQNKNQ